MKRIISTLTALAIIAFVGVDAKSDTVICGSGTWSMSGGAVGFAVPGGTSSGTNPDGSGWASWSCTPAIANCASVGSGGHCLTVFDGAGAQGIPGDPSNIAGYATNPN
jgi:hypothetical protein